MTYEKEGYCILSELCPRDEAERLKRSIRAEVRHCIEELETTEEEYLHAVSRWVDPSPVTEAVVPFVQRTIQPYLEALLGTKVVNKKNNVICKTPYATGPVPCHQDIAYSPLDPYEFTVWMPVDDVAMDSGVLQILPRSQFDPIAPAVDFWQVNFIDRMRTSARWISDRVDLPIQAGDAVLFDSRVWHGSAPSSSRTDRFAVVSRWSRVDWVNRASIPEKQAAPFGMWTAGRVTEEKLKKYVSLDLPYEQLVERAIEKLERDEFSSDRGRALRALKALSLLNKAAAKHNGGDAQGVIYPEVWNAFLRGLS